jgi:chromate transport protein ChrA
MNPWTLFVIFLESVLLSYSGWASVSVVRSSLVAQHGLLTDDQLTVFLALSQITPGPLGFYLLFVGYALRGWIGGFLAWSALVVPSLLVIPIVKLLERGRNIAAVKGAVTGVVIVSAVLMLATAAELAPHTLSSPFNMAIATVSLVALFSGRLPSFGIVGTAAILGAVR